VIEFEAIQKAVSLLPASPTTEQGSWQFLRKHGFLFKSISFFSFAPYNFPTFGL